MEKYFKDVHLYVWIFTTALSVVLKNETTKRKVDSFKYKARAGEMVQLVKCLPYKLNWQGPGSVRDRVQQGEEVPEEDTCIDFWPLYVHEHTYLHTHKHTHTYLHTHKHKHT